MNRSPRSVESALLSLGRSRPVSFTPWMRSRGTADSDFIRLKNDLQDLYRRVSGDHRDLRTMIKSRMIGSERKLEASFVLAIPTILACAEYPDRCPGSAMLRLLVHEETRYGTVLARIPAYTRLMVSMEEGYLLLMEFIDHSIKVNPWRTLARRLPARLVSECRKCTIFEESLSGVGYEKEAEDNPGPLLSDETTQSVRTLVKASHLTHWEVQKRYHHLMETG